jgi:two-component system cell cycle response regulator
MKIFVVEDQPIDAKLTVHVLSAAGYEVDRAGAAENALTAIRAQEPDLILLDICLPGMDGLSLARMLKIEPATRNIPLVAMTSYPEKYSKADAMAAGCDAYLCKPLNTRTLPALMAQLVANAETESTHEASEHSDR